MRDIMHKLGAVIVAAGKSSRMGTFKPLLPLNGTTIIEQVIETLKKGGVTGFTVVTGRESERLQRKLSACSGMSFVENRDYMETDMFHSTKMGLKDIAGKSDMVFFLPADVPLFKAESLVRMVDYMNKASADIVVPTHNGQTGHPVLMKNSAISELVSYGGVDGLRGAIARFCGKSSSLELPDNGILLDVDTPQDYELIRSLTGVK